MTPNFKTILLSVFAALSLLPAAQPDERNKETLVTLTASVEIQGVVLPAGKYLFKLVDDDANGQTIQVFNEDHRGPLAIIPAAPADDEGVSEQSQSEEDDMTGPDIAPDGAPDFPFDFVVVPPPDEDEACESVPQDDDDGAPCLTATDADDTSADTSPDATAEEPVAPGSPVDRSHSLPTRE